MALNIYGITKCNILDDDSGSNSTQKCKYLKVEILKIIIFEIMHF